MNPAHLGTPFLFFVAFLLLLLATLSVPIIKSIYLFEIGAVVSAGSGFLSASASVVVKFGIFGWCSSPVLLQASFIHESQPAQCSPTKLGCSIGPALENILSSIDAKSLVDSIEHGLSIVLVLHPVACALTFIALIFTLWSAYRPQAGRISSAIATGSGILAAVITTLVFIIDCVFTAIARTRIHKATEGKAFVKFGNAEWIVLVAAIILWIATAGACWGIVRSRKQRGTTERY